MLRGIFIMKKILSLILFLVSLSTQAVQSRTYQDLERHHTSAMELTIDCTKERYSVYRLRCQLPHQISFLKAEKVFSTDIIDLKSILARQGFWISQRYKSGNNVQFVISLDDRYVTKGPVEAVGNDANY